MIAVICEDIRFYKDFLYAQGINTLASQNRFRMIANTMDAKACIFTDFIYPHRSCWNKELEAYVKTRIR